MQDLDPQIRNLLNPVNTIDLFVLSFQNNITYPDVISRLQETMPQGASIFQQFNTVYSLKVALETDPSQTDQITYLNDILAFIANYAVNERQGKGMLVPYSGELIQQTFMKGFIDF